MKIAWKKKEKTIQSLDDFLEELKKDNIEVLSLEQVKGQLKQIGTAILTRDFDCGIRISKVIIRDNNGKFREAYKTWTTNLTNSDKWVEKFGLKIINIE